MLPLDEIRLLPMQLRVGGRDPRQRDWEVVSRPVGIQKKHVIARVPGAPETEKEQRRVVYERVRVRRRESCLVDGPPNGTHSSTRATTGRGRRRFAHVP